MSNHTIHIQGYWSGQEDSGNWNSDDFAPSLTSFVDDGTDWQLLFDKLDLVKTYGNDTYSIVANSTYGVGATFSLLNGAIKLNVESTADTVRTTARDLATVQTSVNDTKTKADDIYSVLTSLNDDFAEYNGSYDADIVERDRRFSNIEQHVTEISTYLVNTVMPKLNHIDSGIDSVITEIGRVGSAVQNLSSKVDTQSAEIKQKVDENKQSLLSCIRDSLYACLRGVCALLEPVFILCRPSRYNSASASVSVAESGAVTVNATTESDMFEWQGTSQNFTVTVKQVEGYGPFKSETGNHEYIYSDELKQVLALPYRR